MEDVHPQEDSPTLAKFRKEIDEADDEIVRLIRAREFLSSEAQRLKRQLGLPPRDREREEAIVRKYVAAFGDADDARALARSILTVCRGR